ncbi:uncharacterized protein LOC143226150 [Tachypleus tridentatus]|uniref:uncharacterized protein LOC143226150 n=1 Tax=Tachypleus tridentatus TaxID=6853 RepID=UPI003FD5CDB0
MKPEIRGCIGASIVAILAGFLVVAAGVATMALIVLHSSTTTDILSWWFLIGVMASGFFIMTLGFLGSVCAFFGHLSTTRNQVEAKVRLPVSPAYVGVAPPPVHMYQQPSQHIQMWSPYHQGYGLPEQVDILSAQQMAQQAGI